MEKVLQEIWAQTDHPNLLKFPFLKAANLAFYIPGEYCQKSNTYQKKKSPFS